MAATLKGEGPMQLTTSVRRRLLAAVTVLGLLAAPLVGGAAEAKKSATRPASRSP